jgi:Holliday junction resolvasome RuvABC DNA-binding subunit
MQLLQYNENRYATKFSNNQSIGTDFHQEVEGEIRERLSALGYSEAEIKQIMIKFSSRIRPYVTGGN